jgi:hypothetical protein
VAKNQVFGEIMSKNRFEAGMIITNFGFEMESPFFYFEKKGSLCKDLL